MLLAGVLGHVSSQDDVGYDLREGAPRLLSPAGEPWVIFVDVER
jgi:hypothetical protein